MLGMKMEKLSVFISLHQESTLLGQKMLYKVCNSELCLKSLVWLFSSQKTSLHRPPNSFNRTGCKRLLLPKINAYELIVLCTVGY